MTPSSPTDKQEWTGVRAPASWTGLSSNNKMSRSLNLSRGRVACYSTTTTPDCDLLRVRQGTHREDRAKRTRERLFRRQPAIRNGHQRSQNLGTVSKEEQ